MNKKVISQMLPGLDLGGMGGPPPAGPSTVERPKIAGPLKSVGEILYDFNIEEYIALHPDQSEEDMSEEVWQEYGGDSNENIKSDKEGERDEESATRTPEEINSEIERTEESKWERLPIGKTIDDITSLEEVIGLMKSLTYGTVKKFKSPAAPAGGGMPPMASSQNRFSSLIDEIKIDMNKLNKKPR
jgi:hypothetical protein